MTDDTDDREQYLEDLREFARELGDVPTRTEMNEHGPHSSTPYYTRWGSWTEAVKAAGLEPKHENNIEDEKLIDELQRLAEELDRLPRFEDMAEHGDYSPHTYVRRWGSWPEAKEGAGLNEETRTCRRESREELIEAIRELGDNLGHPPTQDEMNVYGRYSQQPYYREWGSWDDALQEAGLDPERDLGASEEELIGALRQLADELGCTPTVEDMNKQGKFSVWPYLRVFESWNNAVEAADLSVNKRHGVVGERVTYGSNWHFQRQKALERDKYRCQECGITDKKHRQMDGAGLHVHHIIKVRSFANLDKAHKLNNLLTLCRQCHVKREEW